MQHREQVARRVDHGVAARRPPTPRVPTGGLHEVLALQRRAGNAAVVQAIRAARTDGDEPVVAQRSAVHEVLGTRGRPLDAGLRESMEAHLGANFDSVQVHTGPEAERSAEEIGARAYTSGEHIVIGRGGADPHTLAHELTHVIQQRQGPVAGTLQGDLEISNPNDPFERAAEESADWVMKHWGK